MNDDQIDINSKFNRFLSNLDKLVKTHAPLKKLTKKEVKLRNKPWINGKIQKMIRIKDKLLKKFKKSNDQPTRDLFKKFRNRIAIALKDSKANYYYNYFQTNSKNMKQL